jgi:nicotinate phosphoribosyltransferase
MQKKIFHIASEKDILRARVTDTYFERTVKILKEKKIDKKVVVEIRTTHLPNGWKWAVLAGLEECLKMLSALKIKITVEGLEEGTIFESSQPVLSIKGRYLDFCMHETAILGLLCQASGVATASARCKKAAGERTVLSFGARRMHPAISAMVERNAYIGGCDGASVVMSQDFTGELPKGTMPHSLIILMSDTIEAAKAFNEIMPRSVKTVALIDTFNDEKIEAVRVAQALGKKLFAIRIDTPRNRRGDFLSQLQEVRWELDLRGFKDVKIFVSGGIGEDDILKLNSVVDAYGVGTFISNAPTIDFAFDIVEVEGFPIAKRGKESGQKRLLRCAKCFHSKVIFANDKWTQKCLLCGGTLKNITKTFIRNGEFKAKLKSAREIRKHVLRQLALVDLNGGIKERKGEV